VEGDECLSLNGLKLAGDATSIPVFTHGSDYLVGSKDASVQGGETFARDGIALFHQIVRFLDLRMRVAVPSAWQVTLPFDPAPCSSGETHQRHG
jgi:hypothetical protein